MCGTPKISRRPDSVGTPRNDIRGTQNATPRVGANAVETAGGHTVAPGIAVMDCLGLKAHEPGHARLVIGGVAQVVLKGAGPHGVVGEAELKVYAHARVNVVGGVAGL